MKKTQPTFILLAACLMLIQAGCRMDTQTDNTLHIIHAGSLSYPVKHIVEAFIKENPGVRVYTEAWGSKAGARRVMELDVPCDVYMSADYMVIEHMLIPDHASWYVPFAANEMAIVYTPKSRYADEITHENWHEIMLRPDVSIGRSDPDHDPCGVRAVFTAQLAGILLNDSEITSGLLNKDLQNIRPKETDLLALLETGHVDYILLYRSVAMQHGLNYVRLPAELSLGDHSMAEWYARAETVTLGATPGSTITETGQPMVYGLTIPHKARNIPIAEAFVLFVLNPEKGGKILLELGQPPVWAGLTPYYDDLPEVIRSEMAVDQTP